MDNFKPTWLYIKQHNITGLKYFGMTTQLDPIKYRGSGKYWRLHLKTHGNKVSTIWYQLFTDQESLTSYALNFSIENNIIESDDWANLLFEDGVGNIGKPHTEETRRKIKEKRKFQIITEDTKRKISESNIGKHNIPKSEESIQKIKEARKHQEIKPHSEITKSKMSLSWGNRPILCCSHCNIKSKNVSLMNRYHFDNCKKK